VPTRGEIHGHVHNKKDEKVKTAAMMRQMVKLRLSRCRCPVDGKSNASDATAFAIPSMFRFSEDADDPVLLWLPYVMPRGHPIHIFI